MSRRQELLISSGLLLGGLAPLVLSVGLSAPAQSSGQRTCRVAAPGPIVHTQATHGRLSYDNSRTLKQLQRMRSSITNSRATGAGWFVLGLTRNSGVTQRLRVGIKGHPARNGYYCVTLSSVDLSLSYDSIDVFIARRYRPGTCEHDAVLEHENGHVNNFRDTFDRFVPKVERAVKAAANRQPGLYTRTLGPALREFQARLTRTASPLLDEMVRQVNEADARLDAPRSYRANQARCDNW